MVLRIRGSWFLRVSGAFLLAAVLGAVVSDHVSAAKGAEGKVLGLDQVIAFTYIAPNVPRGCRSFPIATGRLGCKWGGPGRSSRARPCGHGNQYEVQLPPFDKKVDLCLVLCRNVQLLTSFVFSPSSSVVLWVELCRIVHLAFP